MKKKFSLPMPILMFFLLFLFFLLFFTTSPVAGKIEASDDNFIRRVRIAECYNSPQAQLLLVLLNRSMSGIADVPPSWQTLPSATEEERRDLNRASVIGVYDMLFSSGGEYVGVLESQKLLRGSRPLFAERLIIAGPPEMASGMKGLEVSDMLRKIFSEELLFFNSYKDAWIGDASEKLLKQSGISAPEVNRQYIETGREGVDALALAGDEGGFILTGEAAFAQYGEFQRDEKNLVEFGDTGMRRVCHVSLITNAGFRKERTLAADRYFEWLFGEEGKRVVEDFEIGDRKPFVAVR